MQLYIDYVLQGTVALSAVWSEHLLAKGKLIGWTMAIIASTQAAVFF